MELIDKEVSHLVKLNETELRYIHAVTQNALYDNESESDRKVRKKLFIASSLALGIDVDEDGNLKPTIRS